MRIMPQYTNDIIEIPNHCETNASESIRCTRVPYCGTKFHESGHPRRVDHIQSLGDIWRVQLLC